MPKARKYKVKPSTTTNPLQRDEAHIKAQETVFPVIQSLKSAHEKDRKWSSAIIAELVQDDTLRLTLLREGIVNALLDRLTDDNVEVKIDALKSIDALVLKQGESLCKELYRKNILKLIEVTVIAVYKEVEASQGQQNQRSLRTTISFSLLEALYDVLNHICADCAEANDAASKMELFTRSYVLFTRISTPNSLTIAVGQFFLLMTTDRPEITSQVFKKYFPNANLGDILDHIYRDQQIHDEHGQPGDVITMKLILGEIAINICEAYLPDYNVIYKEVSINIIQHAKNTLTIEMMSENISDTNQTLSENLISSLRLLSSVATYLDTFLEAYPDATPCKLSNDAMTDDADPFDDDEMDIDDGIPPVDPSVLTELFSAIPLLLQQKLSIPLIPYALETINDIAWTMTRIPDWEEWRAVATSFHDFAIPRIEGMISLGEDTLSTFLGCIWATAKSVPETFSLDPDTIQLLEDLYGRFPIAEFQVKVVGILGLAAQTESIETNKYIAAFMMREITSQSPLVVIEIMDSIMEVFADGEKVYDTPVFVEGQILTKLKQVTPRLRKKMKSIDSKKESELRERAGDVLENFIEFLKYKEIEVKQK